MNREQRQNIVKFALRTVGFYLGYLLISELIMTILVDTVIITILYAAFGEDLGLLIGNVLLRILPPLLMMVICMVGKLKDKTAEREYLKSMENAEFDVKNELPNVMRAPEIWIENIIYMVILLIFSLLLESMNWVVLIPIPIFFAVNILLTLSLRSKWAAGRLHR